MAQRFLSNLTLLLILNLLIKPIWIFAIDRNVQNLVGAETYGLYFALFNLCLLFNIVLEMGLNNFNNRSIAQEPALLKSYLPNFLVLKSGLSLLFGISILLCAFLIGYNSYAFYLLSLLVINQILISLIQFFRSNIAGLQLFRTDALLSICDKSLLILFAGSFLFIPSLRSMFTIEIFLFTQMAAYALTAIIAGMMVLKQSGRISFNIDLELIKKLFRSTLPYALLGLLMSLYYRMDGLMIERLLGDEGAKESGIYAAGFRVLDAFNMIAFLFASILLPRFARLLKENTSIQKLLKRSRDLLLALLIPVVVSCLVFRHEIMQVLYTEYTSYYAEIFGILICTLLPVAMVYIYGSLLTADGKLRQLNIIAIAGVLINLILNVVLILKMKALGAAIATLITQIIVAILHVWVANRQYQISNTIKAVFCFVLLFLVGWMFSYLISQSSLPYILSFFISGITIFGAAFALDIVRYEDLKAWWKEEQD